MNKVENNSIIHVPRIFVVCNRPDTAALWGYILREKGVSVILESSLEKAVEHGSAETLDVMVIDVDSDNQDLIEVCRSFRAVSMVPLLLLLPTHHETIVLDAYTIGVDDVIVKPISPAVFQAKIMAWARRSWAIPAEGLNLVQVGKYQLDPAKRCLVDQQKTEIKLTNLEFNLLHLLMSQPGRIFSADELIRSIWGTYGSGDHILLKNVIYRLRKKIEVDHRNPVLLRTWPGGYSFQR